METNNLLPSQVNQPEPPVQGEILVQAFTQSIPIDVWESQMQPPSHMVALAPNDLRHILTQRRQTQAAQNAHDAQSVRNFRFAAEPATRDIRITHLDIDSYLNSFRR